MSNWYLWVKAIHIFGVISWFAGIFYLPRFFVNHVMTDEPIVQKHLRLMANKLYRFMTGLMWVAVIPGAILMIGNWSAFGAAPWLWVKLGLVSGLITYHFICGKYLHELEVGICGKSEKYFRIFNEAPVILLILILLLVVLKPF